MPAMATSSEIGGTQWVAEQRAAIRTQGVNYVARRRLAMHIRIRPVIEPLLPMMILPTSVAPSINPLRPTITGSPRDFVDDLPSLPRNARPVAIQGRQGLALVHAPMRDPGLPRKGRRPSLHAALARAPALDASALVGRNRLRPTPTVR
jgi:hypothetical protein